MAKINPNKHIQKRRTEDEMRKALSNFCQGKHTMTIPPQDDDDDVVLYDMFKELLESRQMLEDVRALVQSWQSKLS
jgi:hypothetical protein